ncbi:MAG: Gfo/Idh/MocA family oxidoreductase [Bacteroidales bacterium]|nr:Gfo/Idh/MocA family oxidoreductase [Bacteroidales bacterium]
MPRFSRRQFLQTTALTAGTVALSHTKSSGKILGANETVRVGVAGLNGRGAAHVGSYLRQKNVEIVYLIDPDSRTFKKHLSKIEPNGQKPTCVADVRKALEDKNLDAISIATPNHWHALMTVWACQAGKDVYVEKPCSHNIWEGRAAVEIAKRTNRIVQHGTQSRSSASWAKLAEIVKSGKLGKLLVSRGLCYKNRRSIGTKSPSNPPAEVDFNIWLGPAQQQPHHGNLVHYNWHWFWDFGNGDIGNQGVHQMDIARWMIPNAQWPKTVLSLGGRFGYEDQGQTPNTQMTVLDYGADQPRIIFEVRGLPTEKYHGQTVGNTLEFENGIVVGNQFHPKSGGKPEPLPSVELPPRGTGDQFSNFIQAVRTRNASELYAPILEGHISSGLCHLANISYRLGRLAAFHPRTRTIADNPAATETLGRLEEHLTQNKVKLDMTELKVGRLLTFDGQTEKFTGDAEANALLTRDYRAPFAIDQKV